MAPVKVKNHGINVSSVRKVFTRKDGIPKKEVLLTTEDTFDEIGILLSENKYERAYQKNIMNSVLSYISNDFRENHCNFIRCSIDGIIHRGFSKDENKIKNSLKRDKKRLESIRVAYKKAEELVSEQLELDFIDF